MAAPVRTTLAAAVAAGDSKITVASATSIVAGRFIKVDDEWMKVTNDYVSGVSIPVLRGLNGSAQLAHTNGSGVVHAAGDEFALAPAQSAAAVSGPLNRVRVMSAALNAAGAIPIPSPGTDQVTQLNGTSVVAATLANPAVDNDGDILYIIGNGKAAHTVTYTAGLGNGGAALDVLTFAAGAQLCVPLMACAGIWVPLAPVYAGTLTNITVTAS